MSLVSQDEHTQLAPHMTVLPAAFSPHSCGLSEQIECTGIEKWEEKCRHLLLLTEINKETDLYM